MKTSFDFINSDLSDILLRFNLKNYIRFLIPRISMLSHLAKRRIKLIQAHFVRAFSAEAALNEFATVDPINLTKSSKAQNLCGGIWSGTQGWEDLIDPMTGQVMGKIPNTNDEEIKPFIDSLKAIPKSGLHNPLKNPDRYLLYGNVCRKAANLLDDPKVTDFFAKLIQRVIPKSHAQCIGEVVVTKKFLENFSGDNVRYLARSFANPGDHNGQMSQGFRYPYGPV